jgi:glucose-6-phosphate isomerase
MKNNFNLENINPVRDSKDEEYPQNRGISNGVKPEVRTLEDMGTVLYDKDWRKTADPNMELYYMYRGLKEKDNFRYDVTVIFPKMLGKEFNKTKGHDHIENFGEVYKVLEGRAIFLIQKTIGSKVEDVYAVKAKKGDICVIPRYRGCCAHFTINPLQEILKVANWVDKNGKYDYQGVQENQGACYFYTTDGWVKNENYKNIPPLRFEPPQKSLPKEFPQFVTQ